MQPGRYEKRSPTAVAVMLTSPEPVSRTELTITENISSRGARVVTKAPWSANDSLVIKSLEGDLQSEARVISKKCELRVLFASYPLVTGVRAAAKALGDSTRRELKGAKKRVLSAAARAKIGRAAKKRWAKLRAQAKKAAG